MEKLSLKELEVSNISNLFLISDVHFGCKSDSLEWANNIESYFTDFFIPLVNQHKDENSAIAILGDLFDNRKSINIGTMTVCSSVIKRLSKVCPVFILTGNHDMFKRSDSSITSLISVKYIDNVTIISEPTLIKFALPNVDCLFVPYLGDTRKETEYLRQSDANYAFLHTECIGSVMDNNIAITEGANSGVFKGIRVYSGHIHKRQESLDNRFVYVGSPYHMTRSDIGNIKGVYHLDFNTSEHKFFENTYSPQYKQIRLAKVLEADPMDLLEYVSNSYVDIIISDNEMFKVNLNKVYDSLSFDRFNKYNLKPYKRFSPFIVQSDKEGNQYSNIDSYSPQEDVQSQITQYIKEYVESQEIPDKDKKRLIKLNESIIDSIKNDGGI